VLLIAVASGCNMMKALSFHSAPQTEEIDAEYADLAGKKVVVYVWTRPETLWDYPQLRLDLAAHVSAYLKENVPEVEVIPAPRVEAHLKSLSTMNPDAGELARHFHANSVIHLSIYKFSMRDPGLSQFYRGRISASVVVLDLTAQDGTVKRVPLPDVTVVIPEEGPLGYYNVSADQVRDMTYREFTQATGRKFHNWEKEAK
jgi:hypothetical protein